MPETRLTVSSTLSQKPSLLEIHPCSCSRICSVAPGSEAAHRTRIQPLRNGFYVWYITWYFTQHTCENGDFHHRNGATICWTSKCWLKSVLTNKGCWRGEEADYPWGPRPETSLLSSKVPGKFACKFQSILKNTNLQNFPGPNLLNMAFRQQIMPAV